MDKTELDEITTFLSETPFFSEVSKTSLAHLCLDLNIKAYGSKETVFEKGEDGNEMYVILSGKVKVHDKKHVYGYLGQGDCFGEYALIDNQARSATVTTEEDTSVLRITRAHFLSLMVSDKGFAQGILAVMIKRHRELDVIQERLAASKQELVLANAKMAGLIDGAMDSIIMFNSDFRIVLTNPSAAIVLENDDALQRNILFFFDEEGANLIESIVTSELNGSSGNALNNHLPKAIKVIGSNGTETLNEGTISKYGTESASFYTLILRNIQERLIAEDKISSLTNKTQYLEKEIQELTNSYGIIGEHQSVVNLMTLIEQVAKTDATVLIQGETGTGKELVARAVHNASHRKDQPLIRINCGAIPSNLIESELFGHKKGAFTGATVDRKGRFLLADGGTIFLDEIGEMPLDLQPKLLRVIQEGEFDPVGSSETIKVNVRVIAATHRDLLAFSAKGKFREDLYYRLNVFPIKVPALRERGDDVVLIAREMISKFSAKLNKPVIVLSEDDTALFSEYTWPGNVRELQNLIERAVIVSNKGKINWHTILPISSGEENAAPRQAEQKILTAPEITALEKENILKALKKTKWKISGEKGAAKLLQLKPTTLTSKIKALGITRPV